MFTASCYDRRHHGEHIRRLTALLAVQVRQHVIHYCEAVARAIDMGVPTDALQREIEVSK